MMKKITTLLFSSRLMKITSNQRCVVQRPFMIHTDLNVYMSFCLCVAVCLCNCVSADLQLRIVSDHYIIYPFTHFEISKKQIIKRKPTVSRVSIAIHLGPVFKDYCLH